MRTQPEEVLPDHHSALEDKQYSEQKHQQAIEFQKEMEENKKSSRHTRGTSPKEARDRADTEPNPYKRIRAVTDQVQVIGKQLHLF